MNALHLDVDVGHHAAYSIIAYRRGGLQPPVTAYLSTYAVDVDVNGETENFTFNCN